MVYGWLLLIHLKWPIYPKPSYSPLKLPLVTVNSYVIWFVVDLGKPTHALVTRWMPKPLLSKERVYGLVYPSRLLCVRAILHL